MPQEFVEIYRTRVIPHAALITPNQTEASMLAGVDIHTISDAKAACVALHALGTPAVVITSLECQNTPEGMLDIIASIAQSQSREESKTDAAPDFLHLRVPKVTGYLSGTGDLCSALLLGWIHKLCSSSATPHDVLLTRTGLGTALRHT